MSNTKSTTCIVCGAAATDHSPSGTGYCTEHYTCCRGHPPDWVRYRGLYWVCRCVIEPKKKDVLEQNSLFMLPKKI